MSLERRKPFACFLPANGLSLSIILRDINHLIVNVCKWFKSLYFYKRRKPFACYMKTVHFKNVYYGCKSSQKFSILIFLSDMF